MPDETKERKIRRIVGCWMKKLHKIGNTGKTFKEEKLAYTESQTGRVLWVRVRKKCNYNDKVRDSETTTKKEN